MSDQTTVPTYKVQTYFQELGWVMAARAGDEFTEALAVLASYNQNWPAEQHRLVKLNAAGTAWEAL